MPAIVSDLTMTCPAVPVQFEGDLSDGSRFYFRYRFGEAALGTGPDDEAARSFEGRTWLSIGDDYDGSMTMEQFAATFLRLLVERVKTVPSLQGLLDAAGVLAQQELTAQALEAEQAYDQAMTHGRDGLAVLVEAAGIVDSTGIVLPD